MDIDRNGVFKYIQIELRPTASNSDGQLVTLVRGYLDCPYHADILCKFNETEMTKDSELEENWMVSCPGGGRINVQEDSKELLIYGYSQGFGRCDHTLTQALI